MSCPQTLEFDSGAPEVVAALSPHDRCGLVLASGRFTGSEVALLDLHRCDLVVISACDGAIGSRLAVQGRASLQNAFLQAGARTVIAARWPVDDAWTARFMEVFYEHYVERGRPAAESLRVARDVLRRQRASVKDWAGWVLVGEPR